MTTENLDPSPLHPPSTEATPLILPPTSPSSILQLKHDNSPSKFPHSDRHDPPATLATPDEMYGYKLMAISTLGMATGSFFLHIAVATHNFPVWTALLIRATVQILFAFSHFLTDRDAKSSLTDLTTSKLIWLTLRGLIGAIAMSLYFFSQKLLPVGDAATIVYLHPIFAMLIAYIALKEPITFLDAFAALTSFAGVFLIAQPGMHPTLDIAATHRIAGSLYALGAAFLAACAFVIVRGLGLHINFMSSIMSLGLMYMLLSIAMGGIIAWESLKEMWKGALFALLAAVCGFSGQCYTNKGLQHCPAGPGQVVRSVGVAMTFGLGVLFLGERPGWFSGLGACMVLAAAGLIGWSRAQERNRN